MLKDILDAANMYDAGIKHVQHRRDLWVEKHVVLKNHLKEIANYLNANAAFKPGYYVDVFHAFNEEINGTCAELPSVTFRSGDIPMMLEFHNNLGERKEFSENGFRIVFSPVITGQVVVLVYPHYSEFNEKVPGPGTIAVIDDMDKLTMDVVDTIISKSIEQAFYTSFAGMVEHNRDSEVPQGPQVPKYSPIGFKRAETTEKLSSPQSS